MNRMVVHLASQKQRSEKSQKKFGCGRLLHVLPQLGHEATQTTCRRLEYVNGHEKQERLNERNDKIQEARMILMDTSG